MENVILYSTGCARCKALKMKLEKMGIPFKLNEDKDGKNIINLGRSQAPILSIDGQLYSFEEAVKYLNETRA